MLQKQIILRIKNVYTAHAFESGSQTFVGAGSETEPVVQLFDPASGIVEDIGQCPGGMMSIIPLPGKPRHLVSVMGLFPPFQGVNAGLFLHRNEGESWTTTRIFDLPFAHRCEFLPNSRVPFLIAASVSSIPS